MVSLEPLKHVSDLHVLWQQLQPLSQHSFFQSWHWIGNWLECLPKSVPLHVLKVSDHDRVVAAGIVSYVRHVRHGVLPVRTLHLQATGSEDFDCISAEYGNLLVSRGHEHSAWGEVLEFFRRERTDWDEFVVEGARRDGLHTLAATNLAVRTLHSDRTFYSELSAARETAHQSCISLLGPRTRSKVRSNRRGIESRIGKIKLTTASSVDEAQRFLDGLKQLHQRRWNGRGDGGAFTRPFFEQFHRHLIDTSFHDGVLQLARIDAGDAILGYVYNFVHQGRVYFYQSGIDYDLTKHNESPGLLIHCLMMDHNARLGHATYDMLAGGGQYKRGLTTHSEELKWVAIQQPRMKLAVERVARSLHDRLKKSTLHL